MPKKNVRKIIIGLVLIVFGVGLFATAVFYYLEVKPELAKREQIKVKKIKAKETKIEQRVLASQKEGSFSGSGASDGVSLKRLVAQSEEIYGKNEKSRKEGFLWVDQQASQYVVTLGAINNLFPGDYLTVYDGDKKIGQVKVESSFDIISYVQPLEKINRIFQKDYYRVVIE